MATRTRKTAAKTTKRRKPQHITTSEYNGYQTIVFHNGEGDPKPFSFGGVKATRVVLAMTKDGPAVVLEHLLNLCSSKLDEADRVQAEATLQSLKAAKL